MERVKFAVIYYSMTGINYQLAQWAAQAAKDVGADVRLLKVHELAPESAINNNPVWKANLEATKDIKEANSEDLDWADAIVFSVPTRFGNLAAQFFCSVSFPQIATRQSPATCYQSSYQSGNQYQ